MNHQLDQEVVTGFISEAKGYLPEIMLGLESFAADMNQLPSLREAFRFAHIIKGAASMLGFMQISEVAYQLEVTLEMLCEEHLPLSQELLQDLCQHVSDLAVLLDQSLADAPAEDSVHIATAVPDNGALSTAELSTAELSIPELLIAETSPAEPIDLPAALLPVNEFAMPVFALTPSEYLEKGETILLHSQEAEEEILPEARTSWSSYALPEFETEESLVSLLDDTGFSVSLPETAETPTIGDLNLNDVAKELKESFGAYPLPPQLEFALPDELMAGLPEFQLAPQPTTLVDQGPLDKGSTQQAGADSVLAGKPELPDLMPGQLPDVLEDSEPLPATNLAFDNLADQLAEDLLTVPGSRPEEPTATTTQEAFLPEKSAANAVHGDTFIIESMEENRAPAAPVFQAELTPTTPDFQETSRPLLMFNEALPDLLALPTLPELSTPTDFNQQFALAAFDAATTHPEPVPDPATASSSQTSLPSCAISSPAISDEMAEELMETFLLEAEEHLQKLQTSLRVLYKNPNHRDLLQEVRRSSHSLKGTAAMVGLDNIMQLAHRMEDVLDLIYDGAMQLTQERTLLLMQTTDALEDMSNGQSNAGEVQRLYDEFARLLSEDTPATTAAEESLEMIADEPETIWPEAVVEASPESFTATEPEAVEEADLAELPATLETVADISESESEVTPEVTPEVTTDAATEAEAFLSELPFEWTEAVAPETETATEAEPFELTESVPLEAQTETETKVELLVPEPLAEATTEVVEESEEISEPPVEITSELPVEMVSERTVEPPIFTVPAIITETSLTPATPAPVAVAEPVATPTPVHEPEVLPATQTGAMTQASSQFVRVPIERLDDVVKLISEMIITRTMFEQRLADFGQQVEELQMTGTRLRRASSNLESKYEVSTLGGGRPSFLPNNAPSGLSAAATLAANGLVNSLVTHNTHGFDDLEFDRYTEFHLVSRELVESSTDIQTLGRELNHLNSDFLSYLNRQGRIYSDLQDRLMRLRMVPLASLAPRLHRTVRTVSGQQQVELILEGETTAIDTTTLQEMTDPLLHLLRNAIDHGIEAPDVRAAKGKSPIGKIILRAFYEGSQVVIQLRDDGQGLDLNRIRNRALQQALITAAEAESMSAQELWALIFTPGFSTAERVSEISGRGVGMDVVHTTVQKLKGTITIDSQPQAGTTFTIRLPLTLAVTRSLMVKANGQIFAIPLDVVSQIMRLEMSKVERIGKEPVIRLGGKIYPLLMLSRLLNLRQPSDEMSQRPPALLLSVEGKEVVVIVDQLMGGREVVIKTLGNHLRKIHGVMGATLMGDGEVVLILNLAELLRGTVRRLPRRASNDNLMVTEQAALHEPLPTESSLSGASPLQPKTLSQALTIMIVDDSPSVRRVSSNMIKNTGWIPALAKDGLEALEQLQANETPPDLILLDIEMPRMDGYQFLASVRSLPAYRNLPVVIVSSRSSEKHRQKAFDLGATDYLVKPYQEDNVITLIRRLVGENQQ